jgi:hypothetical protein
MVLTIELPEDIKAEVEQEAAARGVEISTYIRDVLKEKLAARSRLATNPSPPSTPNSPLHELWARLDATRTGVATQMDDSRESIYEGCGE